MSVVTMQFTGPENEPSRRLTSKVSRTVPSNSTYLSPVELLAAPGCATSGFRDSSFGLGESSAEDGACCGAVATGATDAPVCTGGAGGGALGGTGAATTAAGLLMSAGCS